MNEFRDHTAGGALASHLLLPSSACSTLMHTLQVQRVLLDWLKMSHEVRACAGLLAFCRFHPLSDLSLAASSASPDWSEMHEVWDLAGGR
jgi:hypothetical protein